MSKFKKKKRSVGVVSTASLPDIVFMILFFFMKSDDPLVEIKPPSASELTSIEQKHLVQYIYIGPALNKDRYGTAPVIQFNDYIAGVEEVQGWVNKTKADKLPEEERNKMIVSLKVDKDTKMGIVTAVKQELRKANALKILYNTAERKRTESR
jgi:biopolymer transport protein ExbD